MATNWKAAWLAVKGITPPTGMGPDDKICDECKKELEKTAKIEKDDAKEVMKQELHELNTRSAEYKQNWNKDGIIQFKNERIAILKRVVGAQVQFIVAYDDLTKEGYRLMAIDEGMQAQGTGITGGVNSFYYFQKMEYVR
jgi:hypothetical protein